MLNSVVKFFLNNKLIAWLLLAMFIFWGIVTAPFNFGIKWLPRDSVSVDAIPDIGENQQIVFTKWVGKSPQDIENQITYPLTTSLLGIPGVKSIRSNSMFEFSSIYVIFEEDVEFYWGRSRILEKLNSLSANILPEGVKPNLGPDATALGQIFWYTLEGKDKDGNTTGGWDLHELRSIQDFYVKYGLSSASGVSEVSSIGGFVQEYQIDINPDKMRVYEITLNQIIKAVKESNLEIGAQTLEINKAEYFVRGLGYVKSIKDIEESVIKVENNVPIRIKDVSIVNIGPASRRGVLDKSGVEAVGGVVVARYGANPLEVINNVKEKLNEISAGLPAKILEDGTESKVSIVPFYDRTDLINKTIGTLQEALTLEILITIIVIVLMLFNLKSSLLVAGALPISVLMCFIAMKYFKVDANIVALSGIAIAIGTMVDMGIVLIESISLHIKKSPPKQSLKTTVYNATTEVASAIITAIATTIISFLPVFTMEASEGKLFRPLAFTKTFALLASIIVTIIIIPPLATQLFGIKIEKKWKILSSNILSIILGIVVLFFSYQFVGIMSLLIGLVGMGSYFMKYYKSNKIYRKFNIGVNILYALVIAVFLTKIWMPLGVKNNIFSNIFFVVIILGVFIGGFYLVVRFYEKILRYLLKIKMIFLVTMFIIVLFGVQIFRNIGQEFMPSLDEGAFLLMPTSMPHSGMEMNVSNLKILDMAVNSIPEVELVVGKAGRVESSLDPAPMSMYENVIIYKSEYLTDEKGHRVRFKVDKNDEFILKSGESISNHDAILRGVKKEDLILDDKGQYFRQWRDNIKSPNDIWNEITEVTKLPGITSAPKLQPIETRLIMLQTGMRAPMGIKVKGQNLKEIEKFGLELEKHLKKVEGVKSSTVFAERIIGKPYLLIDINRKQMSKYGLSISQIQEQIQTSVGGMVMTTTVEGRERYNITLRYPRELRDDPQKIKNIYISNSSGTQIPLGDVVDVRYEQGPQSIKSEDGFLVGYILFDKENEYSEVEVVNNAKNYLKERIDSGELKIPNNINYKFAGNYEQQLRANKKLSVVLPIALIMIFLILYFQFSSVTVSLMVFSGIFIAFSGGFIMIWLYGQNWFMNFDFLGMNVRSIFNMGVVNLSVAVWVGFLALFGIATDDGVLIATFLRDSFKDASVKTTEDVRNLVVRAGARRVRPAIMTTATTILALLPVLTSTGMGSDIMIPMAIPSFGGMILQVVTMFTVPVLYSLWKESAVKRNISKLKKINK